MVTTLKVDGMTCNGCVQGVTTVLKKVNGVSDVQVTLTPGQAKVTHADSVTTAQLIQVVEGAGYEARAA